MRIARGVVALIEIRLLDRHCEERSDDPSSLAPRATPGFSVRRSAEREGGSNPVFLAALDCFASLAMTKLVRRPKIIIML